MNGSHEDGQRRHEAFRLVLDLVCEARRDLETSLQNAWSVSAWPPSLRTLEEALDRLDGGLAEGWSSELGSELVERVRAFLDIVHEAVRELELAAYLGSSDLCARYAYTRAWRGLHERSAEAETAIREQVASVVIA